jgi:hypothetical protein
MPPAIHIAIPDWGKYGPVDHDPGGELLKMGLAASALLMKAQEAGGEERRLLLERTLQLRLKEREGWLAVRTPEHPAGDRVGAAKAAAGIGTVYIKLLAIEQAREWTQRALAELPAQEEKVREYLLFNLKAIDSVAEKRYVHRRVQIHGLSGKPEYNGKCGVVLCHAESRWKVLLETEAGGEERLLLVRQENVTLL